MAPSGGPPARAIIDGGDVEPLDRACLPLSDDGVARGDGAFETVGVWSGAPFRLDGHLERLDASLASLRLPPADRAALRADVARITDGLGSADAMLRLVVSASGTRLVTLAPQPDRPPLRRLASRPAPWIHPPGTHAGAAAKSLSYATNMAATRAAEAAGAEDALLVGLDGTVLEGPTFALLWRLGDELRTPAGDLGVVDSISRRAVVELAEADGLTVREVRAGLDEVLAADEVMVCSAVRPLQALAEIDGRGLPGDAPTTARLAAALERARRSTDG